MMRQESDREDLMREATALTRRAELELFEEPEPIVVGFRRTNAFSIYWGADPVYQFDPEFRLRRAYVDGFLYRTAGETLAKLDRVRTDTTTELHRTDLEKTELQEFLTRARSYCEKFVAAVQSGGAKVNAAIPSSGEVLPAACDFIRQVLSRDVPLAPAIPGRK